MDRLKSRIAPGDGLVEFGNGPVALLIAVIAVAAAARDIGRRVPGIALDGLGRLGDGLAGLLVGDVGGRAQRMDFRRHLGVQAQHLGEIGDRLLGPHVATGDRQLRAVHEPSRIARISRIASVASSSERLSCFLA